MNSRFILLPPLLLFFLVVMSCSESHSSDNKSEITYAAIARGKIDVEGGLLNIAAPPDAQANSRSGAGYGHSATVWISPRLLRWILPAAVLALCVCLFFPWTGSYPSGYPAYTQNALEILDVSIEINIAPSRIRKF